MKFYFCLLTEVLSRYLFVKPGIMAFQNVITLIYEFSLKTGYPSLLTLKVLKIVKILHIDSRCCCDILHLYIISFIRRFEIG